MRVAVCLLACAAFAQTPDPAYAPLTRAYDALRARDYDTAVAQFEAAVASAPDRPAIRKDLAYALLKVGENEQARAQFREAMRLDPADDHVALEYAFLSFEAKAQAEARRIFDRLRKTGNATAEQAFHNIDGPLAAAIERWKSALALGAADSGAHHELAVRAEQCDELGLAAEHYEKAWRLRPDHRTLLLDLGRVWKALDRSKDAVAALLAVSRGGEPYAAELARELLPDRYPYVPEFRRALELDAGNAELRRELAYLLLRMERQPEAEAEFRILSETSPQDLLSATQLAFLLYGRGERSAAQPLFDRVLAGNDVDLANRVRAVLQLPQLRAAPVNGGAPLTIDAKVMAERSIQAGYLKDALKYLEAAHEADPGDFNVMLKLGWTLNILRRDREAFHWFNLARSSGDPQIAAEAARSWRSLRSENERFRFSGWFYPMYSTRWSAGFSYGQVRTELRVTAPLRLYASARFVGDSAPLAAQPLSEQAVILALGVTTSPWRGGRAWFEAGSAVGYTRFHMVPDYRGGISWARRFGKLADTAADAIYVSRFGKDFLFYDQSRFGRIAGPLQLYWNGNVTVDSHRETWANFVETGPGIRWLVAPSSFLTVNLLRGSYLFSHRDSFTDLRAGFWYAFSH
jgi:tetratricopeptide (TPR) repeat protein